VGSQIIPDQDLHLLLWQLPDVEEEDLLEKLIFYWSINNIFCTSSPSANDFLAGNMMNFTFSPKSS
jgi:hypothetical protein